PERQELVALEAEDRLQPLDVLLAEQPVAATRPFRRKQPLILEVTDLRDGDVRVLALEAAADRSDRVQPGGGSGSRHRSRKISRYLPIWTSSPFSRSPRSIRRRFRNVPFRLPRSSIANVPVPFATIAWPRETVTSS